MTSPANYAKYLRKNSNSTQTLPEKWKVGTHNETSIILIPNQAKTFQENKLRNHIPMKVDAKILKNFFKQIKAKNTLKR